MMTMMLPFPEEDAAYSLVEFSSREDSAVAALVAAVDHPEEDSVVLAVAARLVAVVPAVAGNFFGLNT